MEFLNKYDLTPKKILTIAGLALVGIIVVAFAVKLIGSSFGPILRKSQNETISALGLAGYSADSAKSMAVAGGAMPELSARNIAPMPPIDNGGTTGDTAERFEVTSYNSTVETRNLDKTCAAIAGLKPKDYVIFENANEYDHGCNYTFKVERDHAPEILAVVNGLNPKELVENTHTIKKQVDDYTSEIDILLKKKETIEDTLDNAISDYDEISKLATQTRDAETLAKIIDSKIRIIESLTNQRISVADQLDRLARAKADELDKVDYTYFYINIYENKFIDFENLADSWKAAIKKFVLDTNNIIQELSVGLITVIFMIVQYAIYLLLIILAAKYGWRLVKRIWTGKTNAE